MIIAILYILINLMGLDVTGIVVAILKLLGMM